MPAGLTVGITGMAALREEGHIEDEKVASCSTAPLPRMQRDTRHQEMAVKVQGKNTQLFMAQASVVRSETET